MSIGAQIAGITGKHSLRRYWEPEPGIEFSVETPFYFGIVNGTVQYMRFNGKSEIQPDFYSLLYSLEWGKYWPLPGCFNLRTGLFAGSLAMLFEESERFQGNPSNLIAESELAAGIRIAMKSPRLRGWQVGIAGEYSIIYTHRRIKFLFLSAGIYRTFITPKWLRKAIF